MKIAVAHQLPSSRILDSYSSSSLEGINELARGELRRSRMLATWQRRNQTTDEVLDVYRQHKNPNWDGCGAQPISEGACYEAIVFLKKLPSSVPMPEILAEPDGYIGLEWYVTKWQLFVISFSGKGIISYSGLFGQDSKSHGTEPITDSISPFILSNILRALPAE